MSKFFYIATLTIFLSACQQKSEVDKCVDAQVAAAKESIGPVDKEFEAQARILCMQIQSGK